ncbi:hypothetical protein [Bacteroides muris (ex Fokt et al. 2023)]|uniref:Uncharacterized protein n=1 Tax=Bacteroides muris (ex Fokt et al. 2023) TaxID=2937417 RepID=A0A9X2SQ81_9BACE|nr:hypothetical protein [Bacteroides muris (ex Fokt et al. 2023)]MCR6503219.1 hypothetical protein [Bacteroides muris (ex Fokt et al. 2023)]
MFNPKSPRGRLSGKLAKKPQYVLVTENGEERTSNVTDAKIMKAVYNVDSNEYVYLMKCRPVILVRETECFALCFYSDLSFAAFFEVKGIIFRMVKSGVSYDEATDIMCDFFQTAQLPDMSGWVCEKRKAPTQHTESNLSVDGEDFRHFGCADVVAALENIIEGKSKWLLYDFTGENGGYINIHRHNKDGEAPEYKVEWVKWTEPTPIGYHAIVSDLTRLRRWLWDFAAEHKYPDPAPEWKSFDVKDTFQRLTFKFLNEEDKSDNTSDNNER